MNRIVQKFWNELECGIPKNTADSNLLRTYDLQQKRLDDEGLRIRIDTKSRGHLTEEKEIASWKDNHYKTTLFYETVVYSRFFYKKDKKKPIKKYYGNYFLYSDVTECLNYNISANDSYVCPNCGAVSTIDNLQKEGCSYCKTKFTIPELYPRVTGYYAVKDPSGTKEEIKKEILRTTIPVALVIFIYGIINFLITFDRTNISESLIKGIPSLILMIPLSLFFGYIVWAIKKVGGLIWEAGKGIFKLVPLLTSPIKFTNEMKKYSEEFSYEYFVNKIVSILKTIIYSSNDEKLLNYTGEETNKFNHVIESSFTGALTIKDFKIQNNIVTIQAFAYMENFYNVHGFIRRKEEKMPLTIQKDLSKEINYHFNVRAVKCQNCGGSYDATKDEVCPYCGSKIDMLQQDWIITKIG